MIRVCRVGVAALVFAALGSVAVPAVAQTALEDSVKKRPRTGFSPIGLVVGPYDSFLFFPKFETVAEVTDNLFADTVGKKADLALVFKPSFKYQSNWDNHSVVLSGQAEHTRYHDNIDENSLDFGLKVQGRLDVREKTELSSSLAFNRKHQDRGDPDDDVAGVFESDLTISRVVTLKLGAAYNPDVILLKLDTKTSYFDFDDAGTTNNDDRDRWEIEASGRATSGCRVQRLLSRPRSMSASSTTKSTTVGSSAVHAASRCFLATRSICPVLPSLNSVLAT